jgi:hypothetical protein
MRLRNGVHGSMRRDFDLAAMPWRSDHTTKDELAKAIQDAACGFSHPEYEWAQKPAGRSDMLVRMARHGEGLSR